MFDFFAGSGTLGAVAAKLGRRYVLIDSSPKAYDVMLQRLGAEPGIRRSRAKASRSSPHCHSRHPHPIRRAVYSRAGTR